jgi:hypothetical protein
MTIFKNTINALSLQTVCFTCSLFNVHIFLSLQALRVFLVSLPHSTEVQRRDVQIMNLNIHTVHDTTVTIH